jgi:hypothetical protein
MLNEEVALNAIDLDVNAPAVFAFVYFEWSIEYSASTFAKFF